LIKKLENYLLISKTKIRDRDEDSDFNCYYASFMVDYFFRIVLFWHSKRWKINSHRKIFKEFFFLIEKKCEWLCFSWFLNRKKNNSRLLNDLMVLKKKLEKIFQISKNNIFSKILIFHIFRFCCLGKKFWHFQKIIFLKFKAFIVFLSLDWLGPQKAFFVSKKLLSIFSFQFENKKTHRIIFGGKNNLIQI